MENFRLPVKIRYSDIDMNRHVNNAVYFTYMENARTELLARELVQYQDNGILFIVADASCRYRRPVFLNDNIICELAFELLTPLRIGVTYLFKNIDTGQLCAEGKTTLVMVDSQTNKPVRIPEQISNKLVRKH